MYKLKVENDLNLPHCQENLPLNKLIRGSIKRKSHLPVLPELGSVENFWNADQFLLNRASIFKKQDKVTQEAIIKRCNDILMSDFYFLEKSGLAYCAKMILLGETTEIRQLYGLIACDEAIHLEWFTPYVRLELRTQPQGKLLPVLGSIIEDCDANSLCYLVQTIIEGWGFATYKALGQTCQNDTFKKILQHVLKDEAIHHKTGAALFDINKVDKNAEKMIYDRMLAYAEVLRVGPQTVVQCVEKELGELSFSELELLFKELRTQTTSSVQLHLLKTLMNQPGMEDYVQRMIDAGYAKPYDPAECAKIFSETRGLMQFTLNQ
jgi:hypothetical protein